MKKVIFYLSAFIFFVILLITGCKKSTTIPAPDDINTQLQAVDDDARVQNESNAAADDANAVIASVPALSGVGVASGPTPTNLGNLVVGAKSIIYDSASQTITIYYDSVTIFNGRIRYGALSVQLTSGTNWATDNAVLTETFINYKAIRVKDNSPLTINGQQQVTNMTGGLASELTNSSQDTISHQFLTVLGNSGLKITFDNDTTVAWNSWRDRTIRFVKDTVINSVIVRQYNYTVYGKYPVEANLVSWWGFTRHSQNFHDVVNPPIVYDQSIDWMGPVSGQLNIKGITDGIDITYGLNQNGTPAPAGTKPYGCSLAWTDLNGNNRTTIIPYD